MKKKLTMIAAFAALNSAVFAENFDVEIKGLLEPYTWASQNYKVEGKDKTTFQSSINLSQALQNFGLAVQANYMVLDNLYLGLGVSGQFDREYKGKTEMTVSSTDKNGDNNTADLNFNGEKPAENKVSKDLSAEGKGGFFNIPVFAVVKYELPLDLNSYFLGSYVTAKAGLNIPISMENDKETGGVTRSLLNFAWALGAGVEYRGVQFEVLYNALNVNATLKEAADVDKISGGLIDEKKDVSKNYVRHGISLSVGYRLNDLF